MMIRRPSPAIALAVLRAASPPSFFLDLEVRWYLGHQPVVCDAVSQALELDPDLDWEATFDCIQQVVGLACATAATRGLDDPRTAWAQIEPAEMLELEGPVPDDIELQLARFLTLLAERDLIRPFDAHRLAGFLSFARGVVSTSMRVGIS